MARERSIFQGLIVMLCLLMMCLFIGDLPGQQGGTSKQELQVKAKAILTEGEALEKQGKLAEAKAKYEESNSTWQSKDADSHIASVKTKMVDALLTEASKLYGSGDYKQALNEVDQASALQPDAPRVLYNFALCHYKLGDREKALDYIDRCQRALPAKSPDKDRLAQLRSLVVTGETAVEVSAESKPAIAEVNKALAAKLDDKPEEITDYRTAELEQEQAKCKALMDNSSRLPKTGAVLFNLAKCAQNDGRFEDARRYFSDYLKVAPQSLDGSEVQLTLAEIETLAGLKDEKAAELRKIYAEAYRLIMVRRYGEAIEQYKKAEALVPSFAQTKYKLGLLYDSSGQGQQARKYLQEYLALEPNEDAKKPAQALLDTYEGRRAEFVKKLEEGTKDLLAGQYVAAESALRPAMAIFPLSPELNTLLVYTYLNGNNPEAARRAMDTAWSFGYPVSFYAQVTQYFDPSDASKSTPLKFKPFSRAAKIEIEPDTLRLVYLTSVPPPGERQVARTGKKQRKGDVAPTGAAVSLTHAGSIGDKLGNLSGSSRLLIGNDSPDVRTIPTSSLREVKTDGRTVFLRLDSPKTKVHLAKWTNIKLSEDLILHPSVAFAAPDADWPARKFANTYTRLFSQYLGYDGVKLGAEHMTKGEKALIALAVVAVAGGSFESLSNVSKLLGAVYAGTSTFALIQKTLLYQRALAQTMDFKLIPAETTSWSIRTEDFK